MKVLTIAWRGKSILGLLYKYIFVVIQYDSKPLLSCTGGTLLILINKRMLTVEHLVYE